MDVFLRPTYNFFLNFLHFLYAMSHVNVLISLCFVYLGKRGVSRFFRIDQSQLLRAQLKQVFIYM